MKTIKILSFALLFLSVSFAGSVKAALFDTMESVDTLGKVAATKSTEVDRMPASKTPAKPAMDEKPGSTDKAPAAEHSRPE
ncbi:MAG: hypothetical protein H7301_07880 [Cryobacterium sp.]|nr:hypothetical protein [Oligoflexia bacterium]